MVLFHYLGAFILFLKRGNFGSFDTLRHTREKQIRSTYPTNTNLYYSPVESHSSGDNIKINSTVSKLNTVV